jgi:hypothetical protein
MKNKLLKLVLFYALIVTGVAIWFYYDSQELRNKLRNGTC